MKYGTGRRVLIDINWYIRNREVSHKSMTRRSVKISSTLTTAWHFYLYVYLPVFYVMMSTTSASIST
jgi:hypothetical protein